MDGGAGTSLAHDLASGTVIIIRAHRVSLVSPFRVVHDTESRKIEHRGKRKHLSDFDISNFGSQVSPIEEMDIRFRNANCGSS